MRGVVIHCEGRALRCIEGRRNMGRLTIQAVMPVSAARRGEGQLGAVPSRPLHFAFYRSGKLYACARKVVMTTGRRYPGVEHWFVYPDWVPATDACNLRTVADAPVWT
ncbi:MAG: hypothetical protein H0T45_12970 [Pyrinomonadaceae bacterium]|nr:hypothetical protein [Pyrinomonadaceae bacterium]MDQ3253647.1 hypothetical protein [Acidobacteriota bacterium]